MPFDRTAQRNLGASSLKNGICTASSRRSGSGAIFFERSGQNGTAWQGSVRIEPSCSLRAKLIRDQGSNRREQIQELS